MTVEPDRLTPDQAWPDHAGHTIYHAEHGTTWYPLTSVLRTELALNDVILDDPEYGEACEWNISESWFYCDTCNVRLEG